MTASVTSRVLPVPPRSAVRPARGIVAAIARRIRPPNSAWPRWSSISAALMLDHLGHAALGGRIRRAIAATIPRAGLTADLGGTGSTRDVTDAVIRAL